MTEAFPLQWPVGKPRTARPERARFDISQDRAQNGIIQQIRMLGGTMPVISTNIPLRRDGMPYANQRPADDKGVAVYFMLRGQQMCFACDRWDEIKDNMQAIHKTIEALRGIERWGSGDMVQQAFTGFIALPSQQSPYDVLGIKQTASPDEIEAAYRQKARLAPPRRRRLDGCDAEIERRPSQAKRESVMSNSLIDISSPTPSFRLCAS